jgi:hypothetical protein
VKKDFNYTDRLEIPAQLISARHIVNEHSHNLQLEWDFTPLAFKASDELVLDVFVRKTSESLRINLGAVDIGKNSIEIDLTKMRNPSNSMIRVKVIDKSSGLPIIRGVIDNFNPELPEDSDSSRSLLPIIKKSGLRTPWELNYDRGVPTLYITDSGNLYHSLRSRVKAEWFFPIIMHKVFEDIFLWIALAQSFENIEKIDKWKKLFIDHYHCPRDFFETIEEKEGEERVEFAKDQSRLIAESVCFENRDLVKLSSFFENLEGE